MGRGLSVTRCVCTSRRKRNLRTNMKQSTSPKIWLQGLSEIPKGSPRNPWWSLPSPSLSTLLPRSQEETGGGRDSYEEVKLRLLPSRVTPTRRPRSYVGLLGEDRDGECPMHSNFSQCGHSEWKRETFYPLYCLLKYRNTIPVVLFRVY